MGIPPLPPLASAAELAAVTSDPALTSALDDPQLAVAVLADLMPDAPRETVLLVEAVRADVPRAIRERHNMPPGPTIELALAAQLLASRTAYDLNACRWAAEVIAAALGVTSSPPTASLPPPRELTEHAGTIGTREAEAPTRGEPPGGERPKRLWFGWALLAVAAVLAIGGACPARN